GGVLRATTGFPSKLMHPWARQRNAPTALLLWLLLRGGVIQPFRARSEGLCPNSFRNAREK
ncbi:MAG: hypothetical protein RLZZ253_1983, partial [Verrucomicrobiota bacterium]